MDLDREMAEVMGWDTDGHGYFSDNPQAYQGPCGDWHPSTDIAQAMQVVEKMPNCRFALKKPRGQKNYIAGFYGYIKENEYRGFRGFECESDTPAMAICLAAKKALEE